MSEEKSRSLSRDFMADNTCLTPVHRIALYNLIRTSENADLHLKDSCSIIVGIKSIIAGIKGI